MRRRINLLEFINSVSILQELNDNEREKLADCFTKKIFNDGESIITQGEEGDKFYILKEGNATVLKDNVKVKEYLKGD
jgi:cAMP-dependent protein kinase regulator